MLVVIYLFIFGQSKFWKAIIVFAWVYIRIYMHLNRVESVILLSLQVSLKTCSTQRVPN